jgi:hypothetical protein
MYDPTEFIGNFWFGYVSRHCAHDYMQGSPLIEKLNPLRYAIGFGSKRPCRLVWNRNAWMQRKWSNFHWWLWKRHYRAIFGWGKRS